MNGTRGVANFTRKLLSNGMNNIKNLGKNAGNASSNIVGRVRNIVKTLMNNTAGVVANNPIRKIIVVFTNGTKGLVAKGMVLVNSVNPIHWIQVLFNNTRNTVNNNVNNANKYIQNYWNEVLPKISE